MAVHQEQSSMSTSPLTTGNIVGSSLHIKSRHKMVKLRSIVSFPFWSDMAIANHLILLLLCSIPLVNCVRELPSVGFLNAKGDWQSLTTLITQWPQVRNVSLATLHQSANLTDLYQLDLHQNFTHHRSIFLGGTNALYEVQVRDDGTLYLAQAITPTIHSNYTDECPYTEPYQDNQMKMVFTLPKGLIACGTRNCGKCFLYYKFADLSKSVPLSAPDSKDLTSYFVGGKSTLVFRGHYNTAFAIYVVRDNSLLILFSSKPFFTFRPLNLTIAMSTIRLHSSPQNLTSKAIQARKLYMVSTTQSQSILHSH